MFHADNRLMISIIIRLSSWSMYFFLATFPSVADGLDLNTKNVAPYQPPPFRYTEGTSCIRSETANIKRRSKNENIP